jgi:hypothetical protein
VDFSENCHTWDLFSHVDILPIMYIYMCVCDMYVKSQDFFISITVYSYYLHKQYIHIGICYMYVNQCMYIIYIYICYLKSYSRPICITGILRVTAWASLQLTCHVRCWDFATVNWKASMARSCGTFVDEVTELTNPISLILNIPFLWSQWSVEIPGNPLLNHGFV